MIDRDRGGLYCRRMDKNQHPENAIDRAKFDVHPDVDARFTKRVLLPRDRRMIEAYVREGTYAAASRACGRSMATVKNRIENDPAIRKAIGEIIDQASILSGVTLQRVLQEYARLAFVDMGEFMDVLRNASDPEAALVALGDLPADLTAAVSEINIEMTKGTAEAPPAGRLKLKLVDKKGALNDLARVLSLFNDRITIDDNSAYGDLLSKATEAIEKLQNADRQDD